jgi:branched-chain amino acid transport system ATP-binding protein
MFRIEKLNASYGAGVVVRNLTLALAKGEVLCLLGRNGAGKTSTLKSIMGLMPSRTGRLELDGIDISDLRPHQIPGVGIGYVPQGRRLFAGLTVRQNLEIGLLARGGDLAVLERTLGLFPILRERLQQAAETLSGGEQQMLAMARALCLEPKLLLMDEPTEGLMPSMVSTIRGVIIDLAASGVSILLVEQRIEAVLSVTDRVAFMENGTLKDTADAQQIDRDSDLVKKYVGVG